MVEFGFVWCRGCESRSIRRQPTTTCPVSRGNQTRSPSLKGISLCSSYVYILLVYHSLHLTMKGHKYQLLIEGGSISFYKTSVLSWTFPNDMWKPHVYMSSIKIMWLFRYSNNYDSVWLCHFSKRALFIILPESLHFTYDEMIFTF